MITSNRARRRRRATKPATTGATDATLAAFIDGGGAVAADLLTLLAAGQTDATLLEPVWKRYRELAVTAGRPAGLANKMAAIAHAYDMAVSLAAGPWTAGSSRDRLVSLWSNGDFVGLRGLVSALGSAAVAVGTIVGSAPASSVGTPVLGKPDTLTQPAPGVLTLLVP